MSSFLPAELKASATPGAAMSEAAADAAGVSRRTCLSALLGAAFASAFAPPALAQAQLPLRRPVPPVGMPRLVVREARLPVRLDSVSLHTQVLGRAVHTRVEMVFHNPNERVLEGELQFPLQEGQWVSGFALDINGELRPAVPVEKARGQQVFEDVTRARVDPALLEVTQGHNYKLRVYPLPPQGTRRVVLEIAQTLAASGRLELPLRYAERLPHLQLRLMVADTPAEAIVLHAPGLPPPQRVATFAADGHARYAWQLDDLQQAPTLVLQLPPRRTPLVATQAFAGRQYFYAEVPFVARSAPRPAPRRISLLWDASGSGARRDHGREFALLDHYFRALREVEVELRVGRDVVEPAQRHRVKQGRWDELRRVLEGLAYDGASNLPALIAPQGADLALLFSDGLSNWGETTTVAPSAVPLYAISEATGADTTRLRQLAERSGGEWLDLASLSAAEAGRALQTRKPRLVHLASDQARALVAASPYAEGDRLAIAGVLGATQAEVQLEIEWPDGRREHRSVAVKLASQPASSVQSSAQTSAQSSVQTAAQSSAQSSPQTWAPVNQVAQRWAGLRMAELEADFDDRRGEIRRLGKAHGLVSRETSLIVLDALADYVRYEIEPPPSLRADYERALAQQGRQQRMAQVSHLNQVAARFAQQVAWWEQDFPKGTPPAPQGQDKLRGSAAVGRQEVAEMAVAPMAPAPAPRPATVQAQAERRMSADAAGSAERLKSSAASADHAAGAGQNAAGVTPPATIRLAPWAPDSAYARRLRAAPPEAVYQRYLDERPDHAGSTAFFLDVADVLIAKQRPELALRVLSNLAEMDLENRHILRVLGYRLLQAKAPRLALPVFASVQRLSPYEPQSWRDLGLAHAEAGQWQEAADQLWQVVSRPWDGRFPDIDMTALAELNATLEQAARSGQPVRTEAYDARLLRNLPLDLRITLAWDADNTDIDLWVTDPNGERVYYGHRLSYQGGRISRDVTGGYGPEEFALRVAKPGRYTVQAQFYGHRQQVVAPATTLMMRLSTGFGRADQRDELVTLRLAGQSELVTVGSFEVAP